jgi:xylose isomerase
VAFWHSFKGDGSDPFGSGTKAWPWNADKDPLQAAFKAMHANFELMSKLGIDRWCFHDRSVDNHWPNANVSTSMLLRSRK